MIGSLEYLIVKNLTLKTSLGAEMISERRNFIYQLHWPMASAPNANLNTPILAG